MLLAKCLSESSLEPYFLYCGSIDYIQVIHFIIDAYKSISDNENTKLFMIISGGSKKETGLLQDEINKNRNLGM